MENILFGREYNENKLIDSIKYSCLAPDIEIFDNGIYTEIGMFNFLFGKCRIVIVISIFWGENGLNLSGG